MNELLKIGGMNKYISASQPLCQLFSTQPALPHLCKSWGDGICYFYGNEMWLKIIVNIRPTNVFSVSTNTMQ